MKKNTSFNVLTMDRLLSNRKSIFYHDDGRPNKIGKSVYWSLNWLDHHYLPFNYDQTSTNLEFFSDIVSEKNWLDLPQESKGSPTRAVGDLFWMKLPWKKISEVLGGIRIVDLGCGKGSYFAKCSTFSGNLVDFYTGIDIFAHNEWESIQATSPNTNFIAGHIQNIDKILPSDTNFIISQSAVEHFQDDLLFFDRLSSFIRKNGKPTVQVHLLPAASCLKIYRYHGVRQYTPRTLSRITALFKNFSRSHIVALGGQESIKLHTKLVSGSYTKKDRLYEDNLLKCIRRDIYDGGSNPSFWALIIISNLEEDHFEWPTSPYDI